VFQWLSVPDERPYYASGDERIVEIQGETPNVQNALQRVVGHLRKFLVDQSILPLFEKIVSSSN
jgi:poly(rC)-binding protein 3/4